MMKYFKNIAGYCNPEYPALDPTTPWYEFLSYCEACKSLNQTPSLRRYLGYRNYLKSIGLL